MIVPMSSWDHRDSTAGSWWRPIRRAKQRVASATPAKAQSTSCFSPTFLKAPSRLLMWSPFTCIGELSSRSLLTKTRSLTRTAGVATPPPGRRPGKSSPNGYGTCALSWDISLNLLLYEPLSLPPPSASPLRNRQERRGMASRRSAGPGKLDASQARTLPSSRMELCAARLANPSSLRSGAENKEAPCVSSMRPGSQIVAAVGCGCSVNGTASRRSTRAG